jgi:hypothetical protein
MRYQDVRDRLQQISQAQGACSREWAVTDDLIMCVDLDMSTSLPRCPLHSEPTHRAWPRCLRVSFFRRSERDEGADAWIHAGGADRLEPVERAAVAGRQRQIHEWVVGDLAELPPSTSTVIAARLGGPS